MSIRYGLVGVLLVVLVPFAFVKAQEVDADAPDEEIAVEEEVVLVPPNTVSCFDYYQFGSVQANLSASVSSTVSGTPIAFSGTLKNDNSYPIVDGALYVKVFKKRGGTNDGNGPDVVDQFFVKGDISIPAKGSVPITFQWRVPSYAQSGDYELATFFTTSRKFNLLGLSFTDDVVGNRVPFTISGEVTSGVAFNKAGVTINSQPYYFAAFPPRADATSPVLLKATVTNTTGGPQSVTIAWTVYQWDGQLRENVVQEEVRQVNVPAGTSQVAITVKDTEYPVYLAVGTLRWMDSQSIIGARFVREGVDRTRINFPGVTAFPLRAGEENTLFSCLHNSGANPVVSGGSLDLMLTDRDGAIITEYRYDGDITGAMMGVASQFTPHKSYDYFTLSARLYQGGNFVDEANLVYDCQLIDPNLCTYETPPTFLDSIMGLIRLIGMAVGGIMLLIIVLWIYRRVTRLPSPTQLPPM